MQNQWIKLEFVPKCVCGRNCAPPKNFKVYSGSFIFHTKNAEGIVLITTVEAKFMVENFKEIGQLIQDEVLSKFPSSFVLDTVELKRL